MALLHQHLTRVYYELKQDEARMMSGKGARLGIKGDDIPRFDESISF